MDRELQIENFSGHHVLERVLQNPGCGHLCGRPDSACLLYAGGFASTANRDISLSSKDKFLDISYMY